MDIPRLFVGTLLLVGLFVLYDAWGTTSSSADVSFTPQQSEQSTVTPQVVVEQASLPVLRDNRVLVTRVIDGDTIEIQSGERVRYIGVNTPESVDPVRSRARAQARPKGANGRTTSNGVDPRKKIQCFGKEAANKNKKLVEGKYVRLEADIEDKDRYGRLLRYVWFGGTMVNEVLVANGHAQLMTIPPNVKYVGRFKTAQIEARAAKRGLWKTCKRVDR